MEGIPGGLRSLSNVAIWRYQTWDELNRFPRDFLVGQRGQRLYMKTTATYNLHSQQRLSAQDEEGPCTYSQS